MNIAKMIDHTLLKQNATADQIRKLCREAAEYGFASVCINPDFVALAAHELDGTDVSVCTVIGFPLGANTSAVKAFETTGAIEDGADEVDMVINCSAVKAGDWDYVQQDIEGVVAAARTAGAEAGRRILVKVILETCLLTDPEKVMACQIAKAAGADFVKTSTGFSTGGATPEDVALMRQAVGPDMGIKAAGGIHTADEAKAMIEAGATRLGASAGIAIAEGWNE
ncbi:MAG: deoxyribose-phosphate aldolase [Eubacterium sp.]|nr:deoxyribose-phosphate aldolase [Eubacterium sp.]